MADVMQTVEALRKRLASVKTEASERGGRVAALKEQYAAKAKGMEKFGVTTVEGLEVFVRQQEELSSSQATHLTKLLGLYDAGRYAEVVAEGAKGVVHAG